MKTEELTRLIGAIADERQAAEMVALDVGDLVGYTDVIIVCTARNERMAKSIHDAVHERLKHEHGLLPTHSEGVGENRWILLDYLDCILHVFVPETRERYRLEQLWGEAEELDLGLPEPPHADSAGAVRHPA